MLAARSRSRDCRPSRRISFRAIRPCGKPIPSCRTRKEHQRSFQRLVERRARAWPRFSRTPAAAATQPAPPAVAQAPAAAPAVVTPPPEPERPVPAKEPEPRSEPKFRLRPPEPPSRLPAKPGSAASRHAGRLSIYLGAGGVLALLLGWGGYKLYQRRNGQGAPTTTPALSEFGDGSSSVSAVPRTERDTGSSSQIQTDFSRSVCRPSIPTKVSTRWPKPTYIWPTVDAQAEEILLDALKTDPGRTGEPQAA